MDPEDLYKRWVEMGKALSAHSMANSQTDGERQRRQEAEAQRHAAQQYAAQVEQDVRHEVSKRAQSDRTVGNFVLAGTEMGKYGQNTPATQALLNAHTAAYNPYVPSPSPTPDQVVRLQARQHVKAPMPMGRAYHLQAQMPESPPTAPSEPPPIYIPGVGWVVPPGQQMSPGEALPEQIIQLPRGR